MQHLFDVEPCVSLERVSLAASSTASAIDGVPDAGPFVQRSADGGTQVVFLDRAAFLGAPLTGLAVDEFGRPATGDVWTGTGNSGQETGYTCLDWSTNAFTSDGTGGVVGTANIQWTDGINDNCDRLNSLVCVEQSRLPAATAPGAPKLVFVTSATIPGTSGSNIMDQRCASAATDAGHSGTWLAFIRTLSGAAPNRHSDGPWYQREADGGLVLTFMSRANLSTVPLAPIVVDERGRRLSGTATRVWTGFAPFNTPSFDCGAWSLSSVTGTWGDTALTTAGWSSAGVEVCFLPFALLCLQQ